MKNKVKHLNEEISTEDLEFSEFVSHYTCGGWDGSGLAVWKRGTKYYYAELGHCSCYGPEENLKMSDNDPKTKPEICKILDIRSNDSYGFEHAKAIRDYMFPNK